MDKIETYFVMCVVKKHILDSRWHQAKEKKTQVYKLPIITIDRVGQKKMPQTLQHYNLATIHHRVMWISAKGSERNCLHDKGQSLNTAIKYSLFCSWQVHYSKTILTANV